MDLACEPRTVAGAECPARPITAPDGLLYRAGPRPRRSPFGPVMPGMAPPDDDAKARENAIAFLDRLLKACGPSIDDVDIPLDEAGILTLNDLAGDPDAVLRQPGERFVLARLAAKHMPAADRAWMDGIDPIDVRAWSALPEGRARDQHLSAFMAAIRELRRRVMATAREEPWLKIDEAARLAGESPSRVRKAATERKRIKLPVLLDENGMPAKPLRARVSDVRAWAAKSRAAKEIAATNAAKPGHPQADGSQGPGLDVEGGHGNPN